LGFFRAGLLVASVKFPDLKDTCFLVVIRVEPSCPPRWAAKLSLDLDQPDGVRSVVEEPTDSGRNVNRR